ncbi:MAG: alpha/beta hydrolase [Thermoguttaceae bacterium]
MIRSARFCWTILALGLCGAFSATLQAADQAKNSAPAAKESAKPAKKPAKPTVKPTLADVPYGTHERQVLDFYKAESAQPTPLLFYIHGGGWVYGDKYRNLPNLRAYLPAGISVVSINYRYTTQAQQAGVKPPVEWPMHDAARALQFVRSKAAEWNIDKERIGASGGSAGACTSLWLAFHDDMADPKSSDPVARESTRLWCAAVNVPQTTLDPKQMKEWTPNSRYGGHAFGFMADPKNPKTRDSQFTQFLAGRAQVLPWIKQYSPYEHVTADDPPIYMTFKAPPAIGQDEKDPTHTANFGAKLAEKLQSVGVPCELVYPGAPDVRHPTIESYLLEKLKAPKP